MERLKKSSPAFFALFTFLIVELIELSGIASNLPKEGLERISNAAMFGILIVGFFMVGFPLRTNPNIQTSKAEKTFILLGNLAVSFIASFMNVNVFKHTIRWTRILKDLCGWHLFWFVCTAIQILLLSELGKKILNEIQVFWGWLKKNLLMPVYENLCKIPLDIKKNKTICVYFLLELIYLGIQIHIHGIANAFSDTKNIVWNSIRLFTIVLGASFLLPLIPLLLSKCIEALKNMSERKILSAIVGVAFIAIATIYPPLLKTIAFLILIPTAPAILIGLVIIIWIYRKKKIYIAPNDKNSNTPPPSLPANIADNNREIRTINIDTMKYLSVLLACFIVIPLTLIIVTMILQGGWNQLPTHDPTTLTTWLEFFTAASEVAKSLLKLLI